MPYLRPDDVLSRFADFARDDVREALPAEEAFVRAQVGSAASTLEFVAGELAGASPALDDQEAEFLGVLDDVEAELDVDTTARRPEDAPAGRPENGPAVRSGGYDRSAGDHTVDDHAVASAVVSARERIAAAPVADSPTNTRARERELLEACEDVFAAVDDLPAERARRLRRPLYRFLQARVEAQLHLLGREDGG